MSTKIRTVVLAVVLVTGVCLLGGVNALAEEISCQSCHNSEVFSVPFKTAVHGNIDCVGCHADLRNLEAHVARSEKNSPVNCRQCHQKIAVESFHVPHQNFRCTECHQEIHTLKDANANVTTDVQRKCDGCHAQNVSTTTAKTNRQSVQERECQSCHIGEMFRVQFDTSLHGTNGCTSCHTGIRDLGAHKTGKEKPLQVNCGRCHQVIAQKFTGSFHAIQKGFNCADCHRDIHALKYAPEDEAGRKARVIQKCTECHDQGKYVVLGHAQSVLEGNQDSADCSDCHGLHDTHVYHTDRAEHLEAAREFYTGKCVECHGNREIMQRSGLSADVVEDYRKTYHGKVANVGSSALVAGCAYCHNSHNTLPKTDPRSSIHPQNLVASCERCHKGFHPQFVEYIAHPDYLNREKYPTLFWTFIFMSCLLAGTFLFFWIHTVLWWRKSYWEQHKREKMGIELDHCVTPSEKDSDLIQVQRFSAGERIMHVLLILSFMTLVMTGFPLKYSQSPWAHGLIELWGGTALAGLFHRISAVLLIVLFLYVILRAVRFIFAGSRSVKDWLGQLFGADSLFPNFKDIKDMAAMFRWFFNKGEMPKFDRWTYWEKFDFMAVFWGMFVIGGSGLLLWFPEQASWLFPGWILNVATLIHSEEALLAAIFIFTVHFSNTHLTPSKFPMDRVIFTGRYRLEEMKEQKPLYYERLLAEGKLNALKKAHPGIGLKIVSSLFGYACLLLGFILAVMIAWAFFLE